MTRLLRRQQLERRSSIAHSYIYLLVSYGKSPKLARKVLQLFPQLNIAQESLVCVRERRKELGENIYTYVNLTVQVVIVQ